MHTITDHEGFKVVVSHIVSYRNESWEGLTGTLYPQVRAFTSDGKNHLFRISLEEFETQLDGANILHFEQHIFNPPTDFGWTSEQATRDGVDPTDESE